MNPILTLMELKNITKQKQKKVPTDHISGENGTLEVSPNNDSKCPPYFLSF